MKLLTLAAACAAFATLSAAPAFAADSSVVVKLAQPVSQATKFLAGEAVFNCEGDTCVAASPQSQTFATSTCKIIAAKVGAVTSFSGINKSMDDTRLASCNTVAVARAASGAQLAKH
jgi:hypothetical protein